LRVQPENEIPAGITKNNMKTSVRYRRMNPPRPAQIAPRNGLSKSVRNKG
jgi:hypothetical protein